MKHQDSFFTKISSFISSNKYFSKCWFFFLRFLINCNISFQYQPQIIIFSSKRKTAFLMSQCIKIFFGKVHHRIGGKSQKSIFSNTLYVYPKILIWIFQKLLLKTSGNVVNLWKVFKNCPWFRWFMFFFLL